MTFRFPKFRTSRSGSRRGRFFRPSQHAKNSKVSPTSAAIVEACTSEDSSEDRATSLSHDGSSSSLSSLVSPMTEVADVNKATTCESPETATATSTGAQVGIIKATPKHVAFGGVQVREYALILGDHPDCPYPLSLGWDYEEDTSLPKDILEYDDQRQLERKKPTHKRSRAAAGTAVSLFEEEEDGDDLQELTLYERRMRLRQFGYSERYLRLAERQRRIALALQFKPQDGGAFPFSYNYVTRYAWDRKPRTLAKWVDEEEQAPVLKPEEPSSATTTTAMTTT